LIGLEDEDELSIVGDNVSGFTSKVIEQPVHKRVVKPEERLMVEKTIEITPLPSLEPEEPLFDDNYEK